MKYDLQNDYSIIAHPKVLEALSAVGTAPFATYGLDEYSEGAAEIIRSKIKAPNAEVHFACGGTQANLLVISSALRPHEAVIAATSAHISVHETGAIEATGHKICNIDTENGKLSADGIEAVVAEHSDEHMVLPRLVFISQSTETGLVYTKAELTSISEVCRKHNLYLYIDGARLGYALGSSVCDVTYENLAQIADVFYIGGTKNGAIFGEAIVFVNETLAKDFRFMAKQKGALLSKGAALGIQFEVLLKDGLYEKLASQANAMAGKLSDGIEKAGYEFAYPVQTNMLFPVLPNSLAAQLHERFAFNVWHKNGDNSTVRLVTSWATGESVIDEFISCLKTGGAQND